MTLFAKKTSNSYMFEQSATSGWAVEFFQKPSDLSSPGTCIINAFEQCFKDSELVKLCIFVKV